MSCQWILHQTYEAYLHALTGSEQGSSGGEATTHDGERAWHIARYGRSDEDLFESIEALMNDAPSAEVFACTVGQKPSKAKYYLDDTVEVIKMLQGLASASDPSTAPSLPHFTDIASLHI
jgi:hypothetical protein